MSDKHNNSGNNVLFDDCVIYDNIIYFFALSINALCALNCEYMNFEVLAYLPRESILSDSLISSISLHNSSLILSPMRASKNSVFVFNIENRELEEIELGDCVFKPPYEKYSSSYLNGNELILIGCFIPEIVVVNLETKEINHIVVAEKNGMCFLGCYTRVGDSLYIPSAFDNSVLVFNLCSKVYMWKKVGNSGNMFCGIEPDDDSYWLIPYKNDMVIKWDGDSKFEEYELPKKLTIIPGISFYGGIKINDQLLISGTEKYKSVWMDLTNMKEYRIDHKSYSIIKRFDTGDVLIGTWSGDYKIIGEKERRIVLPQKEQVLELLVEKVGAEEYKECMNIIVQENPNTTINELLYVVERI